MTWIRVDSTLTSEAFIGRLAEALSVRIPTAVGMWVGVTLGLAEHEKTGVAAQVSNASLEQWAGWPGKPGKFAAAFRKHCVEAADDQPDRPGVCKLWWRQQALVDKMRRDASRLREERQRERQERERRESVAKTSRDSRAANEDEDDNVDGNESSSSAETASAALADPHAYGSQCTIAANRGMRENALISGSFNELAASAQDAHLDWIAEGVALDVAVSAIYRRAKVYRPRGRGRYPTTLGYFNDTVRDAWEKHRQRSGEHAIDVTDDDGNLSEAERLARELTGK